MNTIKPYKPKPGEKTRCRICRELVFPGDDYHVSKVKKGLDLFFHVACLETERREGGTK